MTIGSALIVSDVGKSSIEFGASKHIKSKNKHLLIVIFRNDVKQEVALSFIFSQESIEDTYPPVAFYIFIFFVVKKKTAKVYCR
jgi:hypothetical protein